MSFDIFEARHQSASGLVASPQWSTSSRRATTDCTSMHHASPRRVQIFPPPIHMRDLSNRRTIHDNRPALSARCVRRADRSRWWRCERRRTLGQHLIPASSIIDCVLLLSGLSLPQCRPLRPGPPPLGSSQAMGNQNSRRSDAFSKRLPSGSRPRASAANAPSLKLSRSPTRES
ncbi:hypothetical protein BKA93DRAFT_444930 [Sparassis latifolia]